MIKEVTRPIIHSKFWNYESSRQFVGDYMMVKQRKQHIIQSPTHFAQ